MTRTIAVIGGKGGVGKTTLVSNLAYALTELGKDVIAIDANITTPNLGIHLGLQLSPRTLQDALRGDVHLNDTIYPHPYGFKVIPAGMSMNDLEDVDITKLSEATASLTGKTDYVLVDCSAALGREALSAIQSSSEVLIITNPDLPSVADALRTVKVAQGMNKKIIGVVVNKVHGKKHELSAEEIEQFLSSPIVAEIPNDANVPMSVALKYPLVEYAPDSPASIEFKRLASRLAGVQFREDRKSLASRIWGWLVS